MCSFLSTVCPPSLRGHLGKCLCPACRVLLVWCKEMPFPSQLTHRATKSRFRMAVRTPSFSRPQHRLLSKVALTRGRWLRTLIPTGDALLLLCRLLIHSSCLLPFLYFHRRFSVVYRVLVQNRHGPWPLTSWSSLLHINT